MVEQTGIQSSLDEHDMKLYLEKVTNEIYCSFTDLIQCIPYDLLFQIVKSLSEKKK
jgi:hypothetical protein